MATPSAREPKKFVTKSSGIGKTFTKEPAKSVAKKPKKSDDKKNVTKKTVAKKPDRSVESNGWKKPASKRNLDPSGSMLRSKCHFFKLPLEIRFMIYSDLIKSQKMAFLVTCQRIYNEALAVVYRDAIFIVTESREPYLPPWIYGGRDAAQREPISDKIQNLEIHTALELFIYRGEKYEVIDYFGAHYPELQDLNISRRKCWIDLNTHCRLLWEPHMEERLVTMLRALRGFDSVFLHIHQISIVHHNSYHGRPPPNPQSRVRKPSRIAREGTGAGFWSCEMGRGS